MALTEPVAIVAAALITSVGAGWGSRALDRRRKRPPAVPSPKQVQTAMQKRLDQLEDEVKSQNARYIAHIEAQLEDERRANAKLRGEAP